MNKFPPRFGVFALVLLAGAAIGPSLGSTRGPNVFLSSAAAQSVDPSPAPAPTGTPAASATLPQSNVSSAAAAASHTASGRHLAPRDTFYILTYVSARTDKGVEGFEPGQEVHLVEVHRATHTLVVTDGHAQVEVSPSQLTHDMDIAALVRQKDQANQAQVAAYVQAEHAAYEKYERAVADATAADLALHQQEQAAAAAPPEPAPTQATATTQSVQTDAAPVETDDGYYGGGGYGYGSPYVYFISPRSEHTPRTNPNAAAPIAPQAAGKVEALPAARAETGRPK